MPEQTPEQIGREAGAAIANVIADNLEAVIMRLTVAIAAIQAEQAELRDEVNELAVHVHNLEAAPQIHAPPERIDAQGKPLP